MRHSLSACLLLAACSEPPPVDESSEASTTLAEPTSSSDGEESSGSGDAPLDLGDDESSGGTGGAVSGPIDGRACPPDNGLTAANFGMPFVLTWCAGCHNSGLQGNARAGAPPGLDLETIDGVRTVLPLVFDASADDSAEMPPAGGPTEGDRALLGDWLACGAPE